MQFPCRVCVWLRGMCHVFVAPDGWGGRQSLLMSRLPTRRIIRMLSATSLSVLWVSGRAPDVAPKQLLRLRMQRRVFPGKACRNHSPAALAHRLPM